ncbi:PEP/pyruvate-binding domain-containing protein [Streptomyces sp. SBT349]|uniref:PEP/pyruvate-binding domain-containing protein n=1 Tax=Streptomyces sp. SBT349 TaxID=1580539 RepID=UPI00069DBE1B|nr:PEP/pyruvate-binding domain-containing protein [Streptomyces sp. SBT349]
MHTSDAANTDVDAIDAIDDVDDIDDGSRRDALAGVALPLDDPRARRAELTGGKAASLARAAGARLPVLPGFVVLPPGTGLRGVPLREAWRELSGDGATPLVVRSSSAAEDTEESSMAGRFASVLDVRGWEAFTEALRTVRASGDGVTMAVLVQPLVRSRAGGVLFGADPVGGRADRMLVSAVRGGPDLLVGGAEQGTDIRLTRRGRPLGAHAGDTPPLSPSQLRRLAELARRARRLFGAPQDIEFGFDEAAGRLWLFQSRPITAMAAPPPRRRARLLGPGPVAETLPGVLWPLEEDLWVVPMAHGLATALDLAGAAPRRALRSVPVVTTVGGRAVADLALLGLAGPRHPRLAPLNPAPPARRLLAAWRVGRLRAVLPRLAAGLQAEVDKELSEAPHPADLSQGRLIAALTWTRSALLALHAQESLAGALLPRDGRGSGASAALAALHHGRAEGLTGDLELAAARPEVLALVAPSLTEPLRLPAQGVAGSGPGTGVLSPREALRLRVRWVQELQVALVREVAARRGDIRGIALLRWPELIAVAGGAPLPPGLDARRAPDEGPPLPDAFRLAPNGRVVAERDTSPGAARGASGGRVVGTVWDGTGEPPPDAVLVVRTLDPALAPLLPRLTGLVAQTGSPLSHLAVLARELRLAVVTGAADAVTRFPPGTRLLVDGATGEVRP